MNRDTSIGSADRGPARPHRLAILAPVFFLIASVVYLIVAVYRGNPILTALPWAEILPLPVLCAVLGVVGAGLSVFANKATAGKLKYRWAKPVANAWFILLMVGAFTVLLLAAKGLL